MCLSDHAKPTQQARAATSPNQRERELYLQESRDQEIFSLALYGTLARNFAAVPNQPTGAILFMHVVVLKTGPSIQDCCIEI